MERWLKWQTNIENKRFRLVKVLNDKNTLVYMLEC